MSALKLFITTEVKDKNGKTIHKKTSLAKSFTIAFLQFIEVQTYVSVNVNITNTLNNPISVPDSTSNLNAEGAVGDATISIVVGTGATPVANDDHVMETLIAHGVGAGQLQYGATSKVTTQEVGANVDLVLQRTFVNGSGSTINVPEFGMMCYSATYDFLFVHDVVTAVPVANGQTLTVSYTFRTTA